MMESKPIKRSLAAVMAIAVLSVFCLIPQTAFAGTTKPSKPVIKSCKVENANSVKVTWKKSKKASKYKVQYKLKTAKKYKTAATLKAADKTITYTITGLKYSKKYQVRIVAIKGSKKAYSKVKTVTTGKKPANSGGNGDNNGGSDGSGGNNSGSSGGEGDNDITY